jgi:hypothetical protein
LHALIHRIQKLNAAYSIVNIAEAQAQGRVQLMYVVVDSESGHIFGFGLTSKKAMKHFLHGLLSYDGPPLETRPCSQALYRQLQALDRKDMPLVDCRINRNGVAVCRKDMPRTTTRRKG